jgi:DNA-directed RNA polymerase subunit K
MALKNTQGVLMISSPFSFEGGWRRREAPAQVRPSFEIPGGPKGAPNYKRFIRALLISGHSRNGEFMEYTRFEKARIIGARALQISLGAPVIIDTPEDMIDPIRIAMLEFEKGLIPITVNRDI